MLSCLQPGRSVHGKIAQRKAVSLTKKPSPNLAWPGSKTPHPHPQMALYFCSGVLQDKAKFRHYALNVPLYTHFTSPIRRFADVMVHRLLAAVLGKRRGSEGSGGPCHLGAATPRAGAQRPEPTLL